MSPSTMAATNPVVKTDDLTAVPSESAAAAQPHADNGEHDEGSSTGSPSPAPGESNATGNTESEDDIWPPDVEQAFQDALRLYPPIGRRKLLENGKMYGRNELIAKYIQKRTNKLRSRKQVSSHIQVLGKKTKKSQDAHKTALARAASAAVVNSSQNPSAMLGQSMVARQAVGGRPDSYGPNDMNMLGLRGDLQGELGLYGLSNGMRPGAGLDPVTAAALYQQQQQMQQQEPRFPASFDQDRAMLQFASHQQQQQQQQRQQARIGLRNFSAYLESETTQSTGAPIVSRHHFAYLSSDMYCGVNEGAFERLDISLVAPRFGMLQDMFQRGPQSAFYIVKLWANMNTTQVHGLHAVSARYESKESHRLRCVTIMYSFGNPVVEKTQFEDAIPDGDSFVYYCNQSPVCEYMVHFIEKLRALDSIDKMNMVLENFTVLQILYDANTNALLMCTGLVFAVSRTHTPHHVIYKLA